MSGDTPRVVRHFIEPYDWPTGEKTMAWRVVWDQGTVIWTEEEAKAHLIAAAPELYHVARDVKYFLNLIKDEHDLGAELEHVLEEAEEAIAKAEGRTLD